MLTRRGQLLYHFEKLKNFYYKNPKVIHGLLLIKDAIVIGFIFRKFKYCLIALIDSYSDIKCVMLLQCFAAMSLSECWRCSPRLCGW